MRIRLSLLSVVLLSSLAVGVGTAAAYPQIATVSPSSGPAGTSVTITGSNFGQGAKGVLFGTVAAASFIVNDNVTVTAVSPAGIAAGTLVDIRVQGVGNDVSPITTVDQYTFTAPPAPAPAVAPATPAAPPAPYACPRVPTLTGHTLGYAKKVLALDSCDLTITTTGPATGTGIRVSAQSLAPGTPVAVSGPIKLTLKKRATH